MFADTQRAQRVYSWVPANRNEIRKPFQSNKSHKFYFSSLLYCIFSSTNAQIVYVSDSLKAINWFGRFFSLLNMGCWRSEKIEWKQEFGKQSVQLEKFGRKISHRSFIMRYWMCSSTTVYIKFTKMVKRRGWKQNENWEQFES